ncbi:hypothetical protein SLA2020_431000 [Shorea laevis]
MKMKRKGYDCLDWIVLVMHRGGRASEVVDLVNFQENRLDDVVSDEFEPGIPEVVNQVVLPPREEVIHHDHAVPSLHQTVHEVAPHEAGPTSHQNPQGLPLQPQWHSPTTFTCPNSSRARARVLDYNGWPGRRARVECWTALIGWGLGGDHRVVGES